MYLKQPCPVDFSNSQNQLSGSSSSSSSPTQCKWNHLPHFGSLHCIQATSFQVGHWQVSASHNSSAFMSALRLLKLLNIGIFTRPPIPCSQFGSFGTRRSNRRITYVPSVRFSSSLQAKGVFTNEVCGQNEKRWTVNSQHAYPWSLF